MLSQIVKIGADATGFQRVVAGVANVTNKAFASVGKEITNRFLGAFAAGAVIDRITGFFNNTIDYADNIGDLAENLGITTDEVQRLQVASNLAGVRFSKLLPMLQKIIALQNDAAQGDKKAVGIFSALGLDPKQANALQIMEASIGNQAVATELFDRKINNVANTMEKLKTLGPIDIIKQEQIDALGKANDKLEEANRKLTVAGAPVVAGATTGLAKFLETMATTIPPGGLGAPPIAEAIFNADRQVKAMEAAAEAAWKKKNQDNPPGSNSIPPLSIALQSDALSRIGLFVGGRTSVADQMVSIGNYQLSELRAIRQSIQEANR